MAAGSVVLGIGGLVVSSAVLLDALKLPVASIAVFGLACATALTTELVSKNDKHSRRVAVVLRQMLSVLFRSTVLVAAGTAATLLFLFLTGVSSWRHQPQAEDSMCLGIFVSSLAIVLPAAGQRHTHNSWSRLITEKSSSGSDGALFWVLVGFWSSMLVYLLDWNSSWQEWPLPTMMATSVCLLLSVAIGQRSREKPMHSE
eukprot:m.364298 g.364298  ORF g.364298 m.364298 type:complete len:201 (+) comp19968_c0_seq3:2-604(+)